MWWNEIERWYTFNCQSNGMVGFTCSGNSLALKSELRQFFKGDDEKPDNFNSEKEIHKPAAYVNQWRFWSIYNETRTIEFFYNSGSVSIFTVLIISLKLLSTIAKPYCYY